MATTISLLASVITFAFAGAVFWQLLHRPRLYRLLWAAALLCYGVATAVQFVAQLHGWQVTGFRLWYVAGGLLTAAYLGQGTAHLLLPRRLAFSLLALLLAVSLWGALRMATVPLQAADILPPAGKITPAATKLPGDLRALAALLNIYGTLLLVGGAVWSAVAFWDLSLDHRRRAGHRLLANVLIAAGALIVASAGSLETFGRGEFLYAGEIAGITIIFAGFLRASGTGKVPLSLPRRHQPEPVSQQNVGPASATPARSLRRISDRTTTGRR